MTLATFEDINQAFIPPKELTVSSNIKKDIITSSIQNIRGFEFPDQQLAQKRIEQHINSLQSSCNEAALLNSELVEKGIKPLAILPLQAWKEICQGSGLLLLTPNTTGEIKMDLTEIITDIRTRSRNILRKKFLRNVILCVGIVGGVTSMIDSNIGVILTAMGLLVIPIIGIGLAILESMEKRLLINIVNKILLKEKIDPMDIKIGEGGSYTRVIFPPAPIEILSILKKIDNEKLIVAADCDAVTFDPSIEQMVKKGLLQQIELEHQARIAARSFDPIIGVVKGSSVALVAQYGDFRIEKEVIERVAKQYRMGR